MLSVEKEKEKEEEKVEERKLKPTNPILVNVVLRDRSPTYRTTADLKPRDRYRLGLLYL